MPQSDQNDKKIIALFKELPKVEDQRSQEEIYKKIQAQLNQKSQKRKPVFIPVLSTVAALLFLLLISPALFNQSPLNFLSDNKESSQSADMDENSNKEDRILMNGFDVKEEENILTEQQTGHDITLKTAVYEEDLQGLEVFTFGVIASNADVIPVSVTTPASNEDWLTRFKQAVKQINDDYYNFEDAELFFQAIEFENPTTVRFIINTDNHIYFEHGGRIAELVQYTFQNTDIELVRFTDEEGNPVEAGNYGEVQDQEIVKLSNKAYYLMTLDDVRSYLVPDNDTSESLQAAVAKMDEAPSGLLSALIPNDIDVQVSTTDTTATIRFAETLDLQQGDPLAKMHMIEALLLTAKEFGMTHVQFENIEPINWQGFNFEKPVQVPVGANILN